MLFFFAYNGFTWNMKTRNHEKNNSIIGKWFTGWKCYSHSRFISSIRIELMTVLTCRLHTFTCNHSDTFNKWVDLYSIIFHSVEYVIIKKNPMIFLDHWMIFRFLLVLYDTSSCDTFTSVNVLPSMFEYQRFTIFEHPKLCHLVSFFP